MPFEGAPKAMTHACELVLSFAPTWPKLGITAAVSEMKTPDLLLGTGWARALNAIVTWPGPLLTIRPRPGDGATEAETKGSLSFKAVPEDSKKRYQLTAAVRAAEEAEPVLTPRATKLLQWFATAFDPPGKEPAKVPFKATIALKPEAKPVRTPPYRLTEAHTPQLKADVQEYLDKGWVRPSTSPWATPITYVKKVDGTLRLVFDYRKVNAQTFDDASPLPRIDALLAQLHGAKVFSKIDLKQGYNQIAMEEGSIAVTAFVTPIAIRGARHFEWTVLPFGLKNAPPVFQRVMCHVLQDCDRFAIVYMDDVLIYSRNAEEHYLHVEEVLQRLARANLKCNAKKCEWFRNQVTFLRASADG